MYISKAQRKAQASQAGLCGVSVTREAAGWILDGRFCSAQLGGQSILFCWSWVGSVFLFTRSWSSLFREIRALCSWMLCEPEIVSCLPVWPCCTSLPTGAPLAPCLPFPVRMASICRVLRCKGPRSQARHRKTQKAKIWPQPPKIWQLVQGANSAACSEWLGEGQKGVFLASWNV